MPDVFEVAGDSDIVRVARIVIDSEIIPRPVVAPFSSLALGEVAGPGPFLIGKAIEGSILMRSNGKPKYGIGCKSKADHE